MRMVVHVQSSCKCALKNYFHIVLLFAIVQDSIISNLKVTALGLESCVISWIQDLSQLQTTWTLAEQVPSVGT